jgi:pimeloyl-ACP methyl ester carboxylesterase
MTSPASAGNPKPALVILPGLDGGVRLAQPFVERLPQGFAPIVLELQAEAPLDGRLVDWVSDRLPRDGSFFLLGQSLTTPLAVELARRHRVLGLLLVTPTWYRKPAWWLASALRFTPRFLLGLRPPRFAIKMLLLGLDAPADLLDSFDASVRALPAAVMAGRLRAFGNMLVGRTTPEPPCPTLCLHGQQDRLFPGRCPPAGVGLIRHVTLPGPHLLLPRRPAEVAAQVVAFLESLTN